MSFFFFFLIKVKAQLFAKYKFAARATETICQWQLTAKGNQKWVFSRDTLKSTHTCLADSPRIAILLSLHPHSPLSYLRTESQKILLHVYWSKHTLQQISFLCNNATLLEHLLFRNELIHYFYWVMPSCPWHMWQQKINLFSALKSFYLPESEV